MPPRIVTRSTVNLELQLQPGPSEIDYRAKLETARDYLECDMQLITNVLFLSLALQFFTHTPSDLHVFAIMNIITGNLR